ncbi:MAG: hypothetical protein UW92_C0032G0002 [Candidatus Jorgensenbacteria bacterium GW2011_GWA2_45_13]|uniref:Thymidylate synthase complementing protein ThyX n=1 Tax=Candidatus Jorgensenbacteria bacterium GW2011_GWA2_45_13 TaxID=1618662 RepID=A0A0G1P2P2_9BACT|nr:MAG: hypothetical protein UW92_C0032G0002 [Candidatus Jorgensenbacteria bacterium GW2011_GWA2_45_13]
METKVFEQMKEVAREYMNADVEYKFSQTERIVLARFFTNCDKKVFFIRFLPAAISSALLAMYSRIKNPRGLRGHFVDNLLPLILASFLPKLKNEENANEVIKYIGKNGIKTIEEFIHHSDDAREAFTQFLKNTNVDPEYFKNLANSGKIRQFLSLFLDKYGHNSIARVAFEAFGIEGISTLAAKSIEWNRPASGFIELSTRFVSMDKAELYPIWDEIAVVDKELARSVKIEMHAAFETYKRLMRTDKTSFAEFLNKQYQNVITDNDEMIRAVMGEICDVMGNLLPAATLTSAGVGMSGEALPELIRHLYLDATPENEALAEMIMEEAKKTGADQFLRHVEISEWQKAAWKYLDTKTFMDMTMNDTFLSAPNNENLRAYMRHAYIEYEGFEEMLNALKEIPRGEFDKLPNQFEFPSAYATGVMSFRSWRDLHRQTFATHFRTYLTPFLGFYKYDKPAPEWLEKVFSSIHQRNRKLYKKMQEEGISKEMMQYPLALGNLVGFQIGANFREWEFITWQRTKFSVNHEVREIVLKMEDKLRKEYPWWKDISRANTIKKYAFARSKEGIPLPE